MADVVEQWLNEYPEDVKRDFIEAEYDDLVKYHHGLGQRIRNHFGLWHNDYESIIENGVDISPQHPDAISMRVINEAWRRKQKGK